MTENHHESFGVDSSTGNPQLLVEIPHRDGSTYFHARDGKRLAAQHERVFELMSDGRWRTPKAIEAETGDSWASISARLRDFRKQRFGGHDTQRRYVGDGLFEYRLILNNTDLFT